jgi:glycosyltransferase involved in cell wall biosynthesis
MNKKKRVIVIGHEASLSGAPILLLNLFQLLTEKQMAQVQFVIRKGGPLVEKYEKVAPVIVLKPSDYGKEKGFLRKTINFFQNKLKLSIVLLKVFSCDYIFCNTIVNGKLLRWVYYFKKPVITYVHELQGAIDLYIEQNDAVLPLSISTVFAYPSLKTMQLLCNKYKTPVWKLKRLNYYFHFKEAQYNSNLVFEKSQQFKRQFGIKEQDFVVGAVGTVSERKGVELFIDVCKKVCSVNPAIKFIWIGSFEEASQEIELKLLVKENNLERNLIFTGPLDYDIYNFSPFDILFLSSKEDTYPLVVLEAALMRIPTICFSGSGGIVEFVNSDAGWIIDDFSTATAADKIVQLPAMKQEVKLRGENAFQKVISRHCNPAIIIDQYNSIIEAI